MLSAIKSGFSSNSKNQIWFYLLTFAFIAVDLLFMVKKNYYFNLLPLIVLVILYAIFSLDKLVLFIVFFVPISVPLRELIPHLKMVDMSLPTEPLLFGVMILFLLKLLIDKKFDKKILTHPISIAIYVNCGWILITALTSTMPLVSMKFFVSRCWFIIVFYFIATQIFKNYNKIETYIWCYIIPMIFVIGFALFRLSKFGFFNQKAAHEVMNPIFNDHTSYAAVIAMFFPFLIGLIFTHEKSPLKKMIALTVLIIFIVGTVFSYTRASWISLAVALVFWLLIKIRIKLKFIISGVALLIIVFFMFKTEILMKLEQNRQDSSTNLTEHIQSMSNVSSDASNVERLNRWSCAMRMFEEKPIFGWGPGTYMFKYAPFQLSYEKTIISTNAGNRGNAHSEYIGPLAESGLFGSISFILIVLYSLYTATQLYFKAINKQVKSMALALILGLVTYYVHGFLNNFLDTDKISALFWGFTAMIVALQVYHNKIELIEKEVQVVRK